MKLHPALFLLALGACGTPGDPKPHLATPPPVNHQAAEDSVVAIVDGKPIFWSAVASYALKTQKKDLIDQYIAFKLREDKLAALGIANTPDELQARARIYLENFRKSEGEDKLKKELETLKVTEAEYVTRFATHLPFQERLLSEKLFMYSLLTETTIEVDTIAFSDEEDAKGFLAVRAKAPFDKATEHLLKNPSKGRIAQWPRYRFSRGLAPDTIAASNRIEDILFRMKKDETSGIEFTSNELKLVMHVVDIHPAKPGTYADHKERILKEILQRPPSEGQLRLWMQRLFRESKIEYESRNTSGNKGR